MIVHIGHNTLERSLSILFWIDKTSSKFWVTSSTNSFGKPRFDLQYTQRGDTQCLERSVFFYPVVSDLSPPYFDLWELSFSVLCCGAPPCSPNSSRPLSIVLDCEEFLYLLEFSLLDWPLLFAWLALGWVCSFWRWIMSFCINAWWWTRRPGKAENNYSRFYWIWDT